MAVNCRAAREPVRIRVAELVLRQEGQALPLAEILLQAQSSQVIDSMNTINQLARNGQLRTAMDEAFFALTGAPSYLPLHMLIGLPPPTGPPGRSWPSSWRSRCCR